MRIIDVLNNTTTGTSTATTPELIKVHNLIIMDESGSMSSIYRPALNGVNSTIETIRSAQDENPNQSHTVTLVTFDSHHYNAIYRATPASATSPITPAQYNPRGGTPLYDAMGKGIEDLRRVAGPDDVVLVTIITDGYENASTRYNAATIKALVEQMKELGWVFTYIGANQDVEAVASSMAIDNHLAWETTEEDTNAMFAKEKKARIRFCSSINNKEILAQVSRNYFDEEDKNLPF